MSTYHSKLASAKAMLTAGNLPAARRDIEDALKERPDSIPAFNVLFQITQQESAPAALYLANQWLERFPKSVDIQVARYVALIASSKHREAKAALVALRDEIPNDPETLDQLELMFLKKWGGDAKVRRKIKDMREKHGGDETLDRHDMLNRLQSGRMIGTTKAVEKVLEANPRDALAHMVMATESHRTFRFAKARKHAKQIMELEPEAAIFGKEIYYASYAAYFPPFFLAHVFAYLMRLAVGWLGWAAFVLMYFAGGFILLLLAIPALLLKEIVPIPNYNELFLGFFCVWLLYQYIFFGKYGALMSKRKGSVALNPNY